MPFPVDLLSDCTHEDVETSGWNCVAELERGNPDNPEFFPLPDQTRVRHSKSFNPTILDILVDSRFALSIP